MAAHDDLLIAARDATGLDDFGDDSFREGLERLVRALRDEASLNAVGELAVPFLIVNLFSYRLPVEEWYRSHPEIDDEPIEAAARRPPTVDATGPHECQDLMALDFKAHYFQAFAHIPSYSSWLLDADPADLDVEATMAVPPWIQGRLFPEAAQLLATSVEGKLMGGPRFAQRQRAAHPASGGPRRHRVLGPRLAVRPLPERSSMRDKIVWP